MEQIRARVDAIVKDPKTAAALKPYYPYGCKRPTFHDNYQLDPDITKAIRFRFITYRGINRRAVYITMRGNETLENTRKRKTNEDGEDNIITIHDLQLTCGMLM